MASLTTLTLVAAPVSWTHYQCCSSPAVGCLPAALPARPLGRKLGWVLLSCRVLYPVLGDGL